MERAVNENPKEVCVQQATQSIDDLQLETRGLVKVARTPCCGWPNCWLGPKIPQARDVSKGRPTVLGRCTPNDMLQIEEHPSSVGFWMYQEQYYFIIIEMLEFRWLPITCGALLIDQNFA